MNEDKIAIYKSLVSIVKASLHEKIDKDKLMPVLERMADMFDQELYNDLLLLFYSNSKENYLYSHIANNVVLAISFATSLGLPRQDVIDVGLCAFAHDFGMFEYLELFKKPGQLSAEETTRIRQHPQKSAQLFESIVSSRVIDGILDIHECVNGKGYPKGKAGTDISFLSRVVSICDIFEALTHARNFRSEFTPFAAMKMIIKKKDVMFEANVVKKFVEFMSIYPVGSIVKINTGETGLVVAAHAHAPTRSVVRVLLNDKSEIKFTGKVIDLATDPVVYISGIVDPKEEKEILQFLKPRGEV